MIAMDLLPSGCFEISSMKLLSKEQSLYLVLNGALKLEIDLKHFKLEHVNMIFCASISQALLRKTNLSEGNQMPSIPDAGNYLVLCSNFMLFKYYYRNDQTFVHTI